MSRTPSGLPRLLIAVMLATAMIAPAPLVEASHGSVHGAPADPVRQRRTLLHVTVLQAGETEPFAHTQIRFELRKTKGLM